MNKKLETKLKNNANLLLIQLNNWDKLIDESEDIYSDFINSTLELQFINENVEKEENIEKEEMKNNQWEIFDQKLENEKKMENYLSKFSEILNEIKKVYNQLQKEKYDLLNENKEEELEEIKLNTNLSFFVEQIEEILKMYLKDFTSKRMIILDSDTKRRRTFLVYKSFWSLQPFIDKNKKQTFLDLLEKMISK